jgi:hypothetical protein
MTNENSIYTEKYNQLTNIDTVIKRGGGLDELQPFLNPGHEKNVSNKPEQELIIDELMTILTVLYLTAQKDKENSVKPPPVAKKIVDLIEKIAQHYNVDLSSRTRTYFTKIKKLLNGEQEK